MTHTSGAWFCLLFHYKKMKTRRRFYSIFACLLTLLLYQNGIKGSHASLDRRQANETDKCECAVSCQAVGASDDPGVIYLFDSATGNCDPLPSCNPPSEVCGFPSLDECLSACKGNTIGGCESTLKGCCADGITPRDTDGDCVDKTEDAASLPDGGGVRWDLVITGGCLMVLLVAVLTVSGVVAYAYRHKHKQRQRRQYIQEVLQMYEENSASSDSSVDDNAEENNLFDRL